MLFAELIFGQSLAMSHAKTTQKKTEKKPNRNLCQYANDMPNT